MREQEMRECIGQFLKARMRNMLLPATLGLGLAVSGCEKEASESTNDGGPSLVEAGIPGPIAPDFMAQMPDASSAAQGPETGAVALYMAPMPDAQAIMPDAQTLRPDSQAPRPDAQLLDAKLVTKYVAQLPDATVTPEYMAQMPDARAKDALSPDSVMVVRYMAPLPNPGQPVLLYMAQYPGT